MEAEVAVGLIQMVYYSFRDEVKMCSYKDVHVIWNILNGIDTNIPAPKSTVTTRRSYWSWRVLFWSNHKWGLPPPSPSPFLNSIQCSIPLFNSMFATSLKGLPNIVRGRYNTCYLHTNMVKQDCH